MSTPFVAPALQPGHPHQKAATDRPKDYPERALRKGDPIAWDEPFPDYAPRDYTSPRVLAQPDYADPPTLPDRELFSFEAARKDSHGAPLNPRGRTGLTGRGGLGKWGANQAGDPIVTRVDGGKLQMIAIQRGDNADWAIPGGMVDKGEAIFVTLARELAEEALGKQGVDSNQADAQELWFRARFEHGHRVYAGYSDDRRNTDNAWMETQVYHVHLEEKEAGALKLQASDDAAAVRWMELSAANLEKLYSNHGSFVLQAMADWEQSSGHSVSSEGQVS